MRTFVYDFYEKLYSGLLMKEKEKEDWHREGEPQSAQTRGQPEGEETEDLREKFAKYVKEKSVNINKKDEDKFGIRFMWYVLLISL